MRTEVVTILNFGELNEDVQDKVLERDRYINVEHNWYEFLYDDFKRRLKTIGVECETFYWSSDRSSFIQMDKPRVVDAKMLLKAAGFSDLRKQPCREILECGIGIETHQQGGGVGYNYVRTTVDVDTDVVLSRFIADLLKQFLKELDQEYMYRIEDDRVKDMIVCNEFEFLSDGRSWY